MISSDVTNLIERTVTGMGYEFVGVELVSQRHSKLLRIYIDGTDGVLIEDCVKVSNQLSGVFDVEDPISGQYQLEISSPGVERPLFRIEDYQRFKGQQASVELYEAYQGRRKIKGFLDGVQGDKVLIQVIDDVVEFPFSNIRKARLVAELNMGRKKGS
ncbi:MAG: ribosome maturation factor RimP [Gammaproteobacteria bacterium]|nr:ribosome maturation factor RimP [Gammaproteobacteria bacterium]